MIRLRPFWRDTRAASAAEFALVLPAALLLLFGIIDVGNYAWTLNEYEKATQMGTRFAVVTDVVSAELQDETYVGFECTDDSVLRPGDRICREALGTLICSSTGCECGADGLPCPDGPVVAERFGAIVTWMRRFQPEIVAGDVRVEYRGSGLGFAGDPNKPEIAPLVTVRIVNATYTPITLSPFGVAVPLPDFSYSLTLEDGEGATSS